MSLINESLAICIYLLKDIKMKKRYICKLMSHFQSRQKSQFNTEVVKHHQIQPNVILTMFHYKPTPRSLNFTEVDTARSTQTRNCIWE